MTTLTRQADLAPAPADIDGRAVATIRTLAADAVEAAQSGHPGLPLGAATATHVLWTRFLRHDPVYPGWPNRDRFVLSAGHGSALLYVMLHLSGYDLTLDDLRRFRSWASRTPGHPEHGVTPGVETTTGPLGQGMANAVGMALAERMLAERFNVPGHEPVVDHRTFVLASDGDLMEGVSGEAASLAGHLGLDRLVVLYDDNHITIDGSTDLAFSEDVPARFAAYGWHVARILDGEDRRAVEAALTAALADGRPSLLAIRTHIGWGAPSRQDTAEAHGAPLGEEELRGLKERLGWPPEASFLVPEDVREHFAQLANRGAERSLAWGRRFCDWAAANSDLAEAWEAQHRGGPATAILAGLSPLGDAMATRVASGKVLEALVTDLPDLVGGSADLAGSTKTDLGPAVAPGRFAGRSIHFGVREHAMGGILNGLALHGGLRPVGSTFLVFSDYMRPAIRLAAIMQLPVVYLFTHDSIGLGEDGPTHQPVEHLAALRAIPGLTVLRPADGHETVEAWRTALARADGPTALVLSRQTLPPLPPTAAGWMATTGARIVHGHDDPEIVLVATGSEVALACDAADRLDAKGRRTRVVSMPDRETFSALPAPARADILPPATPRLVVEAASAQGWEGVSGPRGHVYGLDRFGASAPGEEVMARLGFLAPAIESAVLALLDEDGDDPHA